ncbi:hypothetical protein CASFOL_005169 [Castilleja foliolosa]|uniref:At4g14310 8-bladed propeller domain-containing protein n=1 Tax=Castilleja foliolosa TaxID=1961234 RepID=A0ABD3E3S0_9LAMI
MSTSSSRRVKERAASAGKITPAAGKSMPTGKENPRPTSRIRAATQKPIARPDKSDVEESRADPRVRKSTSSVPRGRSSSPSEFTRVSSASRNYNSRVSLGPPQKKVNSSFSNDLSSGRYNLRNRVSKDLEKNVKIEIPALKYCGNGTEVRNFRSVAELSSDIAKNEKSLEEKFQENLKYLNLQSSGLGSSARESKMASKSKYPSKLHEKLAFLEGKVKRIASEIKKTKEMLDSNNPDTSKIILSDIQEKISGIEKAMGVVEPDGDTTMLSVESGEDDGKENEKVLTEPKSLIKGVNVEELEGRLFPHDKLIRDRKLSKSVLEESNDPFNVDKGKVVISYLSKKETNAGEVQEGNDAEAYVEETSSMNVLNERDNIDSLLMADENLDEFDNQEKGPNMMLVNEAEESCDYGLNDIGSKSSTGGWFVSEGESVLLAHDDGSCSFHDIANSEEKAVYKPPTATWPNMWQDCWLIRAPSADGCSGKYVVAASAGNATDSGFCSWDFYTKDIRAFHFEKEPARVRTALAPLSNNMMHRRNSMAAENRQWWYKPCGPLIVSTASYQKRVQIYDIRDGDLVMKWDLPKPVSGMDYTSPLFWKNRGKVVVAELDGVSLWDVSSLVSEALMSVSSSGGKISALHVNNGDAEFGGGVRQRISSSEAEGNDGVFCTSDSINVLDFRQPTGIALKIPKTGLIAQSSFSCGDSIYIGCSNSNTSVKKQSSSQIQQFSLRKPKLLNTYDLPESNAHHHFTALTQVWGNSDLVMGVCGLGLYVFDSLKDDGLASLSTGFGSTQNAKEIIGPDDMYTPSFDYMGSRALLISRDRPACWRYLF